MELKYEAKIALVSALRILDDMIKIEIELVHDWKQEDDGLTDFLLVRR